MNKPKLMPEKKIIRIKGCIVIFKNEKRFQSLYINKKVMVDESQLLEFNQGNFQTWVSENYPGGVAQNFSVISVKPCKIDDYHRVKKIETEEKRWQEWTKVMECCPFRNTYFYNRPCSDLYFYIDEDHEYKYCASTWKWIYCNQFRKLKKEMKKKIEEIELKIGNGNPIPVLEWKKAMVEKEFTMRKMERKETLKKSDNITQNSPYLVYNKKNEVIYDFDLDFEENNPRSLMTLYAPIQQKQFKGEVYYFGYRCKDYCEVENFYSKTEYNAIKKQFKKLLKNINYENWFGERYIEKAIEKLKMAVEIDIQHYNEIDTVIHPVFNNRLKALGYHYLLHYIQNKFNHKANYEEIKRIAMIKDFTLQIEHWWEPKSDKEKIWFDVCNMRNQVYWECGKKLKQMPEREEWIKKLEDAKKQIKEDEKMLDQMIDSYNRTGNFKISEIAKDEEKKFKKYFEEYLEFRDILLVDKDNDNSNILLLDENILLKEKKTGLNSTLEEMIHRIEALIEVYCRNNEGYKIFCFTMID